MPPSARVMSHVVIHPRSRCWNWTAARDKGGYGVISIPSPHRTQRAARFSYETFNGKISDGLLVLHRCDNPPCVNPEHLFVGTYTDNVHDCRRKGRLADTRGERHGQSKLTDSKVRAIRLLTGTYRGALEEAAKHFGVSPRTISKVVHGVSWKHVDA